MTAFIALLACLLLPIIIGAADLARFAKSQNARDFELLATAIAALAMMLLGTYLWIGAPT